MCKILNSSGDDIAGTLDSSYYKGQGERQGVEREYIVISESNGSVNGKFPSRELLRARCILGYADNGEQE